MADDDRGPASSPRPLGGAALRQAQGRDHSLFPGPPPRLDDSGGLWTQFSGMPQQPGSPTSLHQWLQSSDDTSLPGNIATARTYPTAASSSPGGSRNSPLDKFAADFLNMGMGPDRSRNAPMHSNVSHHFDYGSRHDMGSPTNFGTPPDFPAAHTSGFSQSPVGPFSSSPSEISGLPPDFSQPPPDFSFTTQPDFSRPPPSFAAHDVPLLPHGADPHQGLTDFLATCSQQTYSHQETGRCGDMRLPTNSPGFDSSSLNNQPLPRLHDIMPGHIDVSLPPPNFMPFLATGDDVFQGSVDFDEHKQNNIHNLERATPAQKRVVRQNSEPAHEEGKAMYVEALRRLNSFGPSGPSYEPFGSTAPQPEDTTETASTLSDDAHPPTSKHTKRKEPSRPSYSDVAKTAKGKSSHSKGETSASEKEFEGFPKATASDQPLAHKHNRHHPPTKRPFTHTRIVNHRAKASQSETGSQGNYVQPNSRYGLDHFDDMADYVRAEQRSSSVETLNLHHNPDMMRRSSVECLNSQQHPATARRSSNSSLSSSTSTAEDISFAKHPTMSGGGTPTEGNRGGVRYRDKSSNLSSKDANQDSAVYNNSSNISNPAPTNSTGHQQSSQQNKSSTNPTPPSSQKLKNDKVFFDPKRIFQSRSSSRSQDIQMDKAKGSEDRGRGEGDGAKKEETVLNNGKPNNTTTKASAASHRKADYINNDLREGAAASTSAGNSGSGNSGGSGKRTNQTAALNRHGSRKHTGKDGMSQNGSGAERSRGGDSRGRRQENDHEDDNSFIRNIDWVFVDEWMKYISDFTMTFARNSFSAVLTLLFYLLGVIMYLAMGAIHLIGLVIGKLWTLVQNRFFKDQGGSFASGADAARRRFGVEENITLPSTGEEAMKRLLACKGKDPYGILGLRSDATDEDIKRYYRRQAVLVHPDKNQEPGAEEAFKILGHAFEMIGEPAKRKEYDAHIFETNEAEAAMREFSDLLTKLQEKVQEAANMMRCDHCGGKHRRVPVDRAWYSARYCDKCNIHHSAKEGDVWAESSMLGFLWHYYACMDNSIYDITEWVSCQRDNFKHMKANAHPVFYRIQTDSSRRHRQGQSGEADLEDFINRLFNKASMSPDGAAPPGWQFPPQQAGGAASQSGWGNSTSSTTSSSNSKRSRRKKKRN